MPQLHLPMFPTGVTHITSELAFEKKDGCITYFNGHMPVFTHGENTDPATTRSRFMADLMRRLADDLSDCFIHIHRVKGRFVPATDSDMAKQQKSPEAYDGYVKDGLVLIRPEAWVKRCAGADHVEVARHLHARGVLLASEKDGKFSKTVQISRSTYSK
jgi:hypothetical protein